MEAERVAESEDSENEPIVCVKSNKNKRSVLEDSEDEEEQGNVSTELGTGAARQEAGAMDWVTSKLLREDAGDCDSDKENVNPEKTIHREDSRPLTGAIIENGDSQSSDSSSAVLSQGTSGASPAISTLKSNKLMSDLFDAEESDDDMKDSSGQGSSEDEGHGSEGSLEGEGHGSEGEEDDPPLQMSDALRKRLAKGAAKRPAKEKKSESKPPRMSEQDKQQLHSETQRIVREKEVHMPYHQPKKLGLDVFLARTKEKQEALQTIKGPRRVGWKRAPVVMTRNEGKCSQAKKTIDSIQDTKLKHSSDEIRDSENAQKKLTDIDEELPDLAQRLNDKQNDVLSEKPEPTRLKTTLKVLKLKQTESLVESQKGNSEPELVSSNCQVPLDAKHEKDEERNCVEFVEVQQSSRNESSECPTMETVALSSDIVSISLVTGSSEKKEHGVEERDSGYLTTPASSSEEDSNGSARHDACDVSSGAVDGGSETSNTQAVENMAEHQPRATGLLESSKDCATLHAESDERCEQEAEPGRQASVLTPSAASVKAEAKKKLLTPKLEALGLQEVKPTLSGGPDSFIDLEEDCGPKQDPGVMNLIERFMKHSAKRPKPKRKDVELSTVTKEKAGETEELKLEKFTYHVETEEEEETETKPGAKLLKLKTRLQEKMAREREKARLLRSQAEQYDNEEGFPEEEEEEEAELTDESESEDEDEIDEEEEEELDDEEYGLDEKPGESNPFVEKEADEEGEGSDEELHLELDSNDTQEAKEKRDEARKDFLEKALSKTKSLPLFDDEVANTESPKASQSSCEEGEISERPFGELSQRAEVLGEDEAKDGDVTDDKCSVEEKGLTDEASTASFSKDISADTSFELLGSMLPAAQRSSKKTPVSPSSRSNSGLMVKARSLNLPIESTQDLFYSNSSPTQVKSTPKADSQNSSFNFQIEESQSLMLDDDGFLKVKSAKKAGRRQLVLSESPSGEPAPDTQRVLGEALGLCSGNFTSVTSARNQNVAGLLGTQSGSMEDLMALCSGKFTAVPEEEKGDRKDSPPASDVQGGMSQLLSLCSGRFTPSTNQENSPGADQENAENAEAGSQSLKKRKRKAFLEESEDEENDDRADGDVDGDVDDGDVDGGVDEGDDDGGVEDGDVESDFIVASGEESEAADGGESESEILSEDEGEPNEEDEQLKFMGFFEQDGKKRKLRRDFVEDEAELSGSEAESDEDDNLDDAADVMEEEAGDHDVNMTEEALRNQVTRVHMKTVLDEDDRELRLMKEIYLEDGDLHSEGGGRRRRFRWRNIDDPLDSGGLGASDDEEPKEEDPVDEKWRLDRYEREKFLQQQQEKQINGDGEMDDHMISLGNVHFRQKKGVRNLTAQTDKQGSVSRPEAKPKGVHSVCPQQLLTLPKFRTGSFLNRSKETLTKIAEIAKPVGSVMGPRNSRSLLFSTVSQEDKTPDEATEIKRPQLKRSASTPAQSAAKKQKVERQNILPPDSIFKLLR